MAERALPPPGLTAASLCSSTALPVSYQMKAGVRVDRGSPGWTRPSGVARAQSLRVGWVAGRWDGGLRAPMAQAGVSAPGPRCTRVSSHLSDCQYLRLPPDRPSRAPWPEPPAPPEAPSPGPFFPLHVVVTSSRFQDTQHKAAPAYRPGLLLHLLPPGPPTGERV